MGYLPMELVSKIVGFLPETGLASYATISKVWQEPVERRTFAHLRISSDFNTMTEFSRLVFPHRRTYLRTLDFTVVLLFAEAKITYAQPQYWYLPDIITPHIRRLFKVLELGDRLDANDGKRTGGHEGITLTLGCIKPAVPQEDGPLRSAVPFLRDMALENMTSHTLFPARTDLNSPMFPIYMLDSGHGIPMVRCVSRLVYRMIHHSEHIAPEGRSLAAGAAIILAKQLPCMRRLDIIASIDLWWQDGTLMPWYDTSMNYFRNKGQFIEALVDAAYLSNTQCMEVSLSMENSMDDGCVLLHREDPGFFVQSMNSMSNAVHHLSHNLVSLDISGAFNRSLFWPDNYHPSTFPESPWPRLRSFHVKLLNWSPGNDFYFEAVDPSWYHNVPKENQVQPLFWSWAKALTAMPAIEQATVKCTLPYDARPESANRDWLVGFQAPGSNLDPSRHAWEANVRSDLVKSPRLILKTRGWRPRATTMELLCEAANKRFPGKDLVELEVGDDENVTLANAYHTTSAP
ncbi:hypothetical protein F4820DRAFT_469504 [Hypoxylon rubiginosum]|uniref:Uncharacterized protein n=1 Tax=Hypoxylon rubiginosum TaxID=110542 RepID=A0ACB9Z2A8_9PEZI|nr:hypothetical protein F4820DRAFT_469504 [Hypoxylon rubiginosum]